MTILKFFVLFSFIYFRSVTAHAYVKEFIVDGKSYPGFDPFEPIQPGIIDQPWDTNFRHKANTDAYAKPEGKDEIVCRKNAQPVPTIAKARAGSYVTFRWSRWQINHIGPIISYLADCQGNCATAIGSRLNWFKIDEAGVAPTGIWATEVLQRQGKSYTIQLPKSIKDGQYLLRHEMIAFPNTFKPERLPDTQIYPICANIMITGGTGKVIPTAVELQGYYARNKLPKQNIQRGVVYQLPGPPVAPGLGNTPSVNLNPGINKNPHFRESMNTLVEPTDEGPTDVANTHLDWYARNGARRGVRLSKQFPNIRNLYRDPPPHPSHMNALQTQKSQDTRINNNAQKPLNKQRGRNRRDHLMR
ncbi:hypothetical protein TWF694_003816 [Orbilia ellipsospora]|uniref:lytic cellulose monooxygenase (C4-dehydrogenating) n=1 Tax=Orbilia ellipsospora TaxID=2528407 RepID=A0AAV9X0I3_9PEZI